MRKFLIRTFVKDHENVKDPKVRERYGQLAGLVGIVTNLFLSAFKIIIGLTVNSIAIIADGVNNLTDMASSAVTLIGFRLASKPEDMEHPYGHARFEYLAGMVVSLLIIALGIKLFTSSVDKVLQPDPLQFSIPAVLILAAAIGVKVWQMLFYARTGEEIQSGTLKATGMDSRNDVIATSAILISIFIGKLTGFQLDGYMGCLVAIFIIYSGLQLIRETTSPLLGKAPDPELVREIEDQICSEDGVLGIHDLVVHDYGPGRIFASVHIEVDAHGDLIQSHDMIDNIERTISKDLKLDLVVHMDPLETNDPLTMELNEKISNILSKLDGVVGFHDLRVVAGYTHSNIVFDIVISPECKLTQSHIKNHVEEQLQLLNKAYYVVVNFDKSYVENNI
ncbi:MAG TPA: cation diffusion facilitator family transporter [Anaerovoracaceae bacterium]|nr:cation diffusion facilitator family transporter [Anaerovoracaceae bacterium]